MKNVITLSLVAGAVVQALVIPDLHITEGENSLEKGNNAKEFIHEQGVANVIQASSNPIKDKYIVVFKQGVSKEDILLHLSVLNQELTNLNVNMNSGFKDIIHDMFNIDDSLSGYIGSFSEQVINIIKKSSLIEFIEQDSEVHAVDFNTQNNAPWGLARISHREPLNLGNFNKYLYDDNAGEGVDAYVVDTGINVHHKEFQDRAIWGKTIPFNDEDIDGNGHGTHCAGTIASNHYGVAKKANVVAVKVLKSNGSGSMSDVIKGVEYVTNQHTSNSKNKKNFKGSTANMSLGGGKSPSLDLVVNAAVKAGVHFAVAAGNENQDACNTSPAAADLAVTVGASTLSDDRAYFSNWGKCVDIFAPGLNILSTYIGSDDATAVLSGTSMASPHVAGLLTYFLSLQPDKDSLYSQGYSPVTPAQLKKKLIDYSTKNVLFDLPADTPNALIFNGAGGDLSDFWSNKSSESSNDNQPLLPNVKDLFIANSATDLLYENVRSVFDKLNIF